MYECVLVHQYSAHFNSCPVLSGKESYSHLEYATSFFVSKSYNYGIIAHSLKLEISISECSFCEVKSCFCLPLGLGLELLAIFIFLAFGHVEKDTCFPSSSIFGCLHPASLKHYSLFSPLLLSGCRVTTLKRLLP